MNVNPLDLLVVSVLVCLIFGCCRELWTGLLGLVITGSCSKPLRGASSDAEFNVDFR